jgi:hypothetical protein
MSFVKTTGLLLKSLEREQEAGRSTFEASVQRNGAVVGDRSTQ